MKKEKILVIGAGGQLGSELTQRLVSHFGVENVLASDVKEEKNIHHNINFELLDVLNQTALDDLFRKNNFTQVYHLAAVLSATGEKNPAFAWKLNMDGLLYVLDACVKYKVEKLYWPSSIAVFGPNTPPNATPQNTTMDPTTVYGISKLAGERWCDWYHTRFGLDVRSLRYPGLIGYKSKPGGGTTDYAVDIFFKALIDRRYECFLKPDTFLPMMYMEDAISATIRLMEAPADRISIRSSYNIGAMSFSPEQIAAEIKNLIPDFAITYSPDFRQSIADSWPKSIDDSVAREDWGWTPAYGLKEMVREMIEQIPLHHGIAVTQ